MKAIHSTKTSVPQIRERHMAEDSSSLQFVMQMS